MCVKTLGDYLNHWLKIMWLFDKQYILTLVREEIQRKRMDINRWKKKSQTVSLNVCCGVFFHTVRKEKTFFFCLTLMPKSWRDWWMISRWTRIQGRAGVTHRIHMESCLLYVNARPSIWKPLLNFCNWHWTCHVINTPPRRRKKTFQMESVCYTPSVPLAPYMSASHIMIQSGAARKRRPDWVCFLVLEQNPAEISSVNHGQMAGYKQGD